MQPKKVWDLGANTGVFSQIAAEQGALALAFDIDPAAVEKSYQDLRQRKETRLLPLVMDLTNPSPAIGWQNAERDALSARGPADMVFALALVHHLAISNNVPLPHGSRIFQPDGQMAGSGIRAERRLASAAVIIQPGRYFQPLQCR